MSLENRTSRWPGALLAVSVLVVLFVIGCVTGRGQPHMQAALDHLQAAKAELQVAEQNKGGHRARAIELVNRAIGEVEAGIEYAASR